MNKLTQKPASLRQIFVLVAPSGQFWNQLVHDIKEFAGILRMAHDEPVVATNVDEEFAA